MSFAAARQEPFLQVEGLALDIGGRDGRFTGLIRALGADRVVMIDPAADEVRLGIEAGVIEADAAFIGTVQEWAHENPAAANSAFVFNMQPHVALQHGFWDALAASLRVGGLLVASCNEATTSLTAWTAAARLGCLEAVQFDTTFMPPPLPYAHFHASFFWRKTAA